MKWFSRKLFVFLITVALVIFGCITKENANVYLTIALAYMGTNILAHWIEGGGNGTAKK